MNSKHYLLKRNTESATQETPTKRLRFQPKKQDGTRLRFQPIKQDGSVNQSQIIAQCKPCLFFLGECK